LRAIGYESNVTDARFFTVSDAGYFVGTVALLNSLRLTGNREDLVVLDRGFTASQRRRLEGRVVLIDGANDARVPPHAVKPFPVLLNPSGVVVVIDSDMLVTSYLKPILYRAATGGICVFPDAPADLGRWFAEWAEGFRSAGPRYYGDGGRRVSSFPIDGRPGLTWNRSPTMIRTRSTRS
jgi:hypothetical protein